MVNFASFSGGHTSLKVGGSKRRKVTRRRSSVRKGDIGIIRRIVERIGTMRRRSVVLVVRMVA